MFFVVPSWKVRYEHPDGVWQEMNVSEDELESFIKTLLMNRVGRFSAERTVMPGVGEQVVSDA